MLIHMMVVLVLNKMMMNMMINMLMMAMNGHEDEPDKFYMHDNDAEDDDRRLDCICVNGDD